MSTRRMLVMILISVLSATMLIALVGARGSFGFGRGSVYAFGEISGKYDKDGDVVLTVAKHPDAAALELYAVCENPGGNVAPGVNPATAQLSLSDTASVSGLKRSKGAVTVQPGDLVADLSESQLFAIFNPADVCPNGNWSVIDAYPVGFLATIDVNNDSGLTGQRFQYVCGTTLATGASPFVDGDAFTGNTYDCIEILDVNNPDK